MTQLRRTVPTALQTLFDSGLQLVTADIYTVTLSGGTAFNWSGYDQAVTVDGTTYTLGPGLESNKLKLSAGVQVDTLTLSLFADAATLINGQPAMPFINGGGLDGAKVQAWRAYAANPGDAWVGKLHRFTGQVSDIDRPSRVQADITVRSLFELLNTNLPRNVYQPACLNTVYDPACAVSKAAYTVASAVTTATDSLRLTLTASGLTQAAGYFSLGAIRFTSGANAGVMRTVRQHAAGGVLTLMQPLPVAAAVGDTFAIYPGCDQTLGTCTSKFSNSLRFRGQPYIPVAETVL